jgi:hypothetical protein
MGNANSFFRYEICSKNLNPHYPLFQRGVDSEAPLKVPL